MREIRFVTKDYNFEKM